MEVKKICVLGAGLMGAGIAQVAAEAGYEVTLRDIEDRFIQGGLNIIKKNYERAISKGKMTKEQAEGNLSKIKGLVDLAAAVKGADVIIEAVIENMDLKKQVYTASRTTAAPSVNACLRHRCRGTRHNLFRRSCCKSAVNRHTPDSGGCATKAVNTRTTRS